MPNRMRVNSLEEEWNRTYFNGPGGLAQALGAPIRWVGADQADSFPSKPTKKAVSVIEPIPEIKSLAHRANQVLGYNRLAIAIKDELIRVLKELDIPVLDKKQVDDYKASLEIIERGVLVGKQSAWQRLPLAGYQQDVPEFVLNKAIQIKEKLPTVEFFVDELQYTRIPDPFLVAVHNREEYYIEVWDEPKFEGRISKEE